MQYFVGSDADLIRAQDSGLRAGITHIPAPLAAPQPSHPKSKGKGSMYLLDQISDDVAKDVRESEVSSLVAVGKPSMVDAQLIE